MVIAWIGGGIFSGISATLIGVKSAAMWAPLGFGIPIFVYLLMVSVLSIFLGKILEVFLQYEDTKVLTETKKLDNFEKWAGIISYVINYENSHNDFTLVVASYASENKKYRGKSYKFRIESIAPEVPFATTKAFKKMCKAQLMDMAEKTPPSMVEVSKHIKNNKSSKGTYTMGCAKLVLKELGFPGSVVKIIDRYDNDFLEKIAHELNSPDIAPRINLSYEFFQKKEQERVEKLERRKNSWGNKTCKKVTESINNVVVSIRNSISTCFKQIGIFFAYMWTLIIAKKKGACPYFRFEDVSKESEKKS